MSVTTNSYQRHKLVIAGFLFIYTLSIFLPGAYSVDTWNQWNEVTSKHFNDWYGTGLVTIWRLLWMLTGNYMCLYVTQMLFYWTFITLLLWQVRFQSVVYWLTLAGALFFCLIPQYIMRDSFTVLLWAIAVLFLLYAGDSNTHRRSLTVIGMLFLALGVWVRINAIVAFLPLAYIGILLLERRPIAAWKRLLLTVGASIILLAGIQLITYKVQKAERQFPEYKLKLLDLTGISRLSGENCFPTAITTFPDFIPDSLYARYNPAGIDDIYWPSGGVKPIFPYPNDSLDAAVTKSWLSAIRRHPGYYLQNRLTGFLYYLHIRKRLPSADYWNVAPFFIFPGPLQLKGENTKLKARITHAYGYFYRTPIFDPWFWLLLNIAGFGIFVRQYRRQPEKLYWLTHAAIQLSGILFILSQVLIYQHDRDFRYTYWNVFVAFLAIPGLFAKRQGAGVSPAP